MAPLHRARVRVIQPAQLAYGPVEGLPELRRAVAAYIRVSRGVRCETGQVFITDGTQSSLELRAHAGESWRIWLAREPLLQRRPNRIPVDRAGLVPIEVDHEGMAPNDEQWRTRPPG